MLRAIPLDNTFGHAETEVAAALMVGALAATGDTWRPLGLDDLMAHVAAQGIGHVARNPFLRPDFAGLLLTGAIEEVGTMPETFAFTASGRAALARWVRMPAEPPAEIAALPVVVDIKA